MTVKHHRTVKIDTTSLFSDTECIAVTAPQWSWNSLHHTFLVPYVGRRSAPWEWFSIALDSALAGLESSYWVILFAQRVACVCSWVVFSACSLPIKVWGSNLCSHGVSCWSPPVQAVKFPLSCLCINLQANPFDKKFTHRSLRWNPLHPGSLWRYL